MVLRAPWGADERYNTCKTAYSPSAKVGFVHHTAGRNDYTPEQSAAVVRGVYAFHTQSRGWCDVGYNFLIDRWSRIFEGRAPAASTRRSSGPTRAASTATASAARSWAPSPPRCRLRRCSTASSGCSPGSWAATTATPMGTQELVSAGGGTSKYPAGQKVRFDVVSGHRDAGNTSCPGNQTFTRMGEIRSEIKRATSEPGSRPRGHRAAAHAERPGRAVITAELLQPTAWRLELRAPGGAVVRPFTGTATTSVRVV